MNARDTISEIKSNGLVIEARLWDKVPGKERIYIDTMKSNGGRSWNGGVGYRTCYIDINAKKLVYAGEAGAATRKHLEPTMRWLSELAAQITN